MDKKILIVDDDLDTIDFIEYNLKKEGFDVFVANNGMQAIEMALEIQPTLILMDVMMPGMDGIETCRELRTMTEFSKTIIIFLTARSEDYSQIAGFEAGGNDYIIKNIRPSVLLARINAFIKRNNHNEEAHDTSVIHLQDLIIDEEKYEITKESVQIPVTKKEFKIMQLIATRPGKVFTRKEIYRKIWGYTLSVGDRTIDVHVRKLRTKLGEQYIRTVKGVGYKAID